MKHNLIRTDNYLLVLDDSEVTQYDYVACPETKELSMSKPTDTQLRYFNKDVWKKVIAHRPLNGAPYLDGVDVLPPVDNGEKREYKEEDLKNAFYNGWLYRGEQEYQYPKAINEFIQSLQQPKYPIAFECEIEYVHDDTVPYPKTLGTQPKTIINSEGRTEWVGKYI